MPKRRKGTIVELRISLVEHMAAARILGADAMPSDDGCVTISQYEPVGVTAGITPWYQSSLDDFDSDMLAFVNSGTRQLL